MQASREAPKWVFPDEEVELSAILVDGLKWEAMQGMGGAESGVARSLLGSRRMRYPAQILVFMLYSGLC